MADNVIITVAILLVGIVTLIFVSQLKYEDEKRHRRLQKKIDLRKKLLLGTFDHQDLEDKETLEIIDEIFLEVFQIKPSRDLAEKMLKDPEIKNIVAKYVTKSDSN